MSTGSSGGTLGNDTEDAHKNINKVIGIVATLVFIILLYRGYLWMKKEMKKVGNTPTWTLTLWKLGMRGNREGLWATHRGIVLEETADTIKYAYRDNAHGLTKVELVKHAAQIDGKTVAGFKGQWRGGGRTGGNFMRKETPNSYVGTTWEPWVEGGEIKADGEIQLVRD